MSLIKIAISPLMIPGAIFSGVGTMAARSGNPLKYMTFKDINSFTGLRRKTQRSALSTIAHSVKEMRAGKVQDSTRLIPAFLDAQTGQFMKIGLGALEPVIHNKSAKGKIVNNLLNQIIDNEGKYNIPNIEYGLKAINKVHNFTQLPHHLYGAAAGGTVGYAVGSNTNENPHGKLKSIIKGGIIGGGLGMAVRKAGQHSIITHGKKLHDAYFKDSYIKDSLEAANSKPYQLIGKAGAKLFTSDPNKRNLRILASEARSELNQGGLKSGFIKRLKSAFNSTWNASINKVND